MCRRAASTVDRGTTRAATKIRLNKGERPDLKEKILDPEVLLQAHPSTMNLTFYEPEAYETGAFPADEGDAFAAMHGSWNREERTGYKVIRIPMEDGKPTGVYEDFMTGFVLDDDTVLHDL